MTTDRGSSTTGGKVTKDTPFTINEFKRVGEMLNRLPKELIGREDSVFADSYMKSLPIKERTDIKRYLQSYAETRMDELKKAFSNGITANDKEPTRVDNSFMYNLFDKVEPVCCLYNELKLLILYEAGFQAKIELFYERLNNTLKNIGQLGEIIDGVNREGFLSNDHHSLALATT